MTTLSPKLEAIRLLRNDLWEHLENAEYLAEPPVAWTPEQQERAGLVIEQLVTVIRGVLIIHESGVDDDSGNQCHTCESPWPCPTLTAAHRLIKDPDAELVRILDATRGYR